MTEDEARDVELVRAVEVEDPSATLLTAEDLAQAEAHARSAGVTLKGHRAADRFIATRATFASTRLATRHPGVARLLKRNRWPRWIGIVIPGLALVAGFVANEFGTGKRLDLLAIPLLGTIAWNLLVYVWLGVGAFSQRGSQALTPFYSSIARLFAFGQPPLEAASPLQRAARTFEGRWAKASANLVSARIARTMHLSAALFAFGLIAGIYLRALVIEYRAGWESTFLDPATVQALLSATLGPASWITGVPIPGVEGVAAMRWTGPETGGVNAGPWIYLYTTTLAGLVIVPRLLLAFWQAARAFRLSRRFPATGREDFYIRRLLRSAEGAPARARVTAYAYQPGDETRRHLGAALRGALGDRSDVRFDEPIEYGAEDRWLADQALDPDEDYHILLFSLSATPEEENHGALAAALAERVRGERLGTVLAALVDEGPFRAHFAGQQGLDERIAGRLDAWRKALGRAPIPLLGIDLSEGSGSALAQRLERGLLPDGAMQG